MKLRHSVVLLIGVASLQASQTSPTSSDGAMEKVLNRYARIHADLVGDSRGQIKDDASLLLVSARKIEDKDLSTEIQDAAKRMVQDSNTGMGHPTVSQANEDFKRLSVPIVAWVKKNKPEEWNVVHCPKLDLKWVQKKGEPIKNPYASADKRSCGEVVKD